MAHEVVHSAQAKVSIGNAILDDLDAQASAAYIKLQNSAQTATYATLTLPTTCGTVNATTGVLTFTCTSLSDTSCSATGTPGAVKARFYDGAGNAILNCSVGIGTTFDINLSNNVFLLGDTVQITALTYTPPT